MRKGFAQNAKPFPFLQNVFATTIHSLNDNNAVVCSEPIPSAEPSKYIVNDEQLVAEPVVGLLQIKYLSRHRSIQLHQKAPCVVK